MSEVSVGTNRIWGGQATRTHEMNPFEASFSGIGPSDNGTQQPISASDRVDDGFRKGRQSLGRKGSDAQADFIDPSERKSSLSALAANIGQLPGFNTKSPFSQVLGQGRSPGSGSWLNGIAAGQATGPAAPPLSTPGGGFDPTGLGSGFTPGSYEAFRSGLTPFINHIQANPLTGTTAGVNSAGGGLASPGLAAMFNFIGSQPAKFLNKPPTPRLAQSSIAPAVYPPSKLSATELAGGSNGMMSYKPSAGPTLNGSIYPSTHPLSNATSVRAPSVPLDNSKSPFAGLALLSQAQQSLKAHEALEPQQPTRSSKRKAVSRGPRSASTQSFPDEVYEPSRPTRSAKSAPSAAGRGKKVIKPAAAKRARGRTVSEEDDDDYEPAEGPSTGHPKERNKFLERNRQAALKCRQRKKEAVEDLVDRVDFLSTENHALKTQCLELQAILLRRKTQLPDQRLQGSIDSMLDELQQVLQWPMELPVQEVSV